jgi:hypothetical protein
MPFKACEVRRRYERALGYYTEGSLMDALERIAISIADGNGRCTQANYGL